MSRRTRGTKGTSHLVKVKELEELCSSSFLSLKSLREKTKDIPQDAVAVVTSDFLHYVCENENVTKGIIEHFIRSYPEAAGRKREGDGAYPLHLAAANCDCPSSAIKLLIKKNPELLRVMVNGMGVPLHCYIARNYAYDINIVDYMVKEYPQSVISKADLFQHDDVAIPLNLLCEGGEEISLELVHLLMDDNRECLNADRGLSFRPIITLVANKNFYPFPIDVLQHFIQNMATDTLTACNVFLGNVLHAACSNPNITLEGIQLLLGIEGSNDMVRKATSTSFGESYLPIHTLCKNDEVDDDGGFEIMKLLVDEYPESLTKEAKGGYLPIHHACMYKPFEYCR